MTGSATSFGADGGNGTLTVNLPRECPWSATAQVSWVVITSAREGQGDGTVSFRVNENPDPLSRRGNLVVSERGVELVQEPAACRFAVAPPADPVSAAGGEATIGVGTHAVCGWTATSDDPWASVTPSSGQGNGVVRVTLTANPGPVRTATLTVAGQRVTVTQAAQGTAPSPGPGPGPGPGPVPAPTPCSISLAPGERSFPASGGSGSVAVTTGSTCTWTVASSAAWVVIASPTSGTGQGEVRYTVAPHVLTSSREALVTVGSSSHRVTQSGTTSGGARVEVEGPLSSLTGSCPNLRFTVRGTVVTTNSSTRFDGRCSDLRNGRRVRVEGRTQSDGTVIADRVEFDD